MHGKWPGMSDGRTYTRASNPPTSPPSGSCHHGHLNTVRLNANLYNNRIYEDDGCPRCVFEGGPTWWPVAVWDGTSWGEVTRDHWDQWRSEALGGSTPE